VDTVFFGGGTPSHTSEAESRPDRARLRDRFAIAEGAELSLEANPEDVTPDALDSWRGLGVNRISIGVQSFHDAELRHSVGFTVRSVPSTRSAIRWPPDSAPASI